MSNEWSIWLKERALEPRFGEFARRPFSHPYLQLRDSEGRTVEKINGGSVRLPYIKSAQELMLSLIWATANETVQNVAQTLTQPFGLYPCAGIFVKPVCSNDPASRSLRPYVFAEQQILSGSEAEMRKMWSNVISVLPELNGLSRPFWHYATPESGLANCQMLLHRAMTHAGMPTPPLQFAHTGWQPW